MEGAGPDKIIHKPDHNVFSIIFPYALEKDKK